MEEAAQILEIETFIPLLLQVNMYDVSFYMTKPENVMSVIYVSTTLGRLSLHWADWWGPLKWMVLVIGSCA